MTTLSSILAWRIPWTKEPGGLQSMGSQRVEHDWVTCFLVSGPHGDRALVEGLSYKQGGRWGDDPSLWDGIQSGQEPMVQTAEDPVSCFPLPMAAGFLFLSWLISSLSRENERRKMEEKLIAQVKDLMGKEFTKEWTKWDFSCCIHSLIPLWYIELNLGCRHQTHFTPIHHWVLWSSAWNLLSLRSGCSPGTQRWHHIHSWPAGWMAGSPACEDSWVGAMGSMSDVLWAPWKATRLGCGVERVKEAKKHLFPHHSLGEHLGSKAWPWGVTTLQRNIKEQIWAVWRGQTVKASSAALASRVDLAARNLRA